MQLSRSAARVQAALEAAGVPMRVVELPDSTRTAADAASAIGCDVAQIAKSLVFRGAESGDAYLIIASGVNRVDEKRLAVITGEAIVKASAEFVKQRTGYAIGGVPPVALATTVRTFIDEGLMRFDSIWAAAGTPNAVFELSPNDLPKLTGGRVLCVA